MSTAQKPYSTLLAAAFGALLAWLLTRTVIDHVPLYDELLHFLSARGINHTGRPAIADGEYTRAVLFTRVVAASLAVFGETLRAARLPALIAAILLAALVSGWVTRRAGILAGLAAVIGLCLVPQTAELAVLARFYTAHALIVFAIGIAAFQATMPDRTSMARARWLTAAVVLIPVAYHLQPTTVIASGALICGALVVLCVDHWNRVQAFVARHALGVVLTASALGIAAASLLARFKLLAMFTEAPGWAVWAADKPYYYLLDLGRAMPLLWPLFPVAAVVAAATHRRLALFSVVVVVAALLVHSLAAAKAARYIYYAMPFFCIVWACALDGGIELLRRFKPNNSGTQSPWPKYLVIGLTGLVLVLSTEGQRAAKLLLGRTTPQESLSYANEPDWSPALMALRPALLVADRIVTSNSMKALYYLGRYDYELNASIVAETRSHQDFGIDERTGRRAIGRRESMQLVIDMPGRSLVILEDRKLRNPVGVPAPVAELIAAQCAAIALPLNSGLSAWQCGD